jgi:DNA-binding NarL/FixJ family response regulator
MGRERDGETGGHGDAVTPRLRILLVDDHALFLHSLKLLLDTSGYEVVAASADGMAALRQARQLHPDLILMDIGMPVCDGLAATRLIKAEMPQVKIVMLTVSASDEHLLEAVKSGASGYLLKTQPADRFLAMVADVARGGAALPPDLAARLLEAFAHPTRPVETPAAAPAEDLTARQVQILTLLARGLTYPQIGEALCLSEATVRYHLGRILDRLHLENRAQVIAYAARHGL